MASHWHHSITQLDGLCTRTTPRAMAPHKKLEDYYMNNPKHHRVSWRHTKSAGGQARGQPKTNCAHCTTVTGSNFAQQATGDWNG
eukprot:1158422-Pelagomonas_calceolata.AAC.7